MDTLHSKRAQLFVQQLYALAKAIFIEEIATPFYRKRFDWNATNYPINIFCFEHPSKLGTCNSDFFEIGINVRLIHSDTTTLKNVLRHEIAHLLTALTYGDVAHHGREFRAICQRFQWNADVSRATLPSIEPKTGAIQSKVHKLLALSNSMNEHEALSALKKAQELLKQHNLSRDELFEEEWRSRKTLRFSKNTMKHHAIATIVRTLSVIPLLHKSDQGYTLVLFGSEEAVELAEYATHFLNHLLETLWQNRAELKGARAKKSFFFGIAEGFKEKLSPQSPGLIQLDKAVQSGYDRFIKSSRAPSKRISIDETSRKAGQKEGAQLELTRAIPSSRNKQIHWQTS